MNFDLDGDDRALQDAIRDLCRKRFPIDRIRALEPHGGFDRDGWRALGEAGVFSIRLPEGKGGLGLGMTEAALAFEELGRAVVPGPLIASHLAAGLLEGVATGQRVVGFAARAGHTTLIAYLDHLDDVLTIDHDGIWRTDASSVTASAVTRPLDPLTPLHQTSEMPRGERLARHPVAARWWAAGSVLAAAQLIGLASGVTETAVAYAKERRQFGRPIGSFQAIKHILADMLVRAEVARAAVYAAACTIDDPSVGDAWRAAAAAKLLANDAAVANAKAALQVHGGMGYTWEVDVHLYLKRAAGLAAVFGQSDELAEAVAASL
ncbi:MAG: acyl-CoA dehydrogenase family protein [Actinomycetota bacterium]